MSFIFILVVYFYNTDFVATYKSVYRDDNETCKLKNEYKVDIITSDFPVLLFREKFIRVK